MNQDTWVTLDTEFAKGIIESKKIVSRAILQCLHYEEIPRKNQTAMLKFLVTLSDGYCYFRTVFCNEASKNINRGQLAKYDIVNVTNYMISEIKQANKTLIMVTDFQRRLTGVKKILGKPVFIDDFKQAGNKNPFGFNTLPQEELYLEPKNIDITNQLYSQYLKGEVQLETATNENATVKKSSQPSQKSQHEETKKKKVLNLTKRSQENADKTEPKLQPVREEIKNEEIEQKKEKPITPRESVSSTSTVYVTPVSKFPGESKSSSSHSTPKQSASTSNMFPDPMKTLFTSEERKNLKEKRARTLNEQAKINVIKINDSPSHSHKSVSSGKKGELLIPSDPDQEGMSTSSRGIPGRKRQSASSRHSDESPIYLRHYQEAREPKTQTKYKSSNSQPLTESLEYLPIKALSCLLDGWIIKARVIKRSLIKPFVNKMGKRSKMFSVDLLDRENGEIEASFFGDLCDRYYPIIDEGKIYFFSGGLIKKPAMKVTSNTNELQIVFDVRADIREAPEDPAIPRCLFNFFTISEILTKENGEVVDIVGIVYEDHGSTEITLKTGETTKKRTILIYDKSKIMIEATFWGTNTQFQVLPGQVVIIKGGKVNEFQGKKGVVSYFRTYLMKDDLPSLPEVEAIQALAQDPDYSHDIVKKRKSFGEIRSKVYFKDLSNLETMLDKSEKYYFDFTITIEHIQCDPLSSIYYIACPQPGCGRKVIEAEPNKWRCTFCYKDTKEPITKYKLLMLLSDLTGRIWATGFDTIGEIVLGSPAQKIRQLKESGKMSDEETFMKIIKDATMKEYNAKILMRHESFKGKAEWKYMLIKLAPLNYRAEARELLDILEVLGKNG